jgi:hypothetical protein
VPASMGTTPMSRSKSVLFPHPEGPMRVVNPFSGTVRQKSAITGLSLKCLVISLMINNRHPTGYGICGEGRNEKINRAMDFPTPALPESGSRGRGFKPPLSRCISTPPAKKKCLLASRVAGVKQPTFLILGLSGFLHFSPIHRCNRPT